MLNIGFVAEFQTGYLQRALALHQATVAGGIDKSVRDATVLGYATRRLVKITKLADGTYTVVAPTTGVGAITAADTLPNVADPVTKPGTLNAKIAAGLGDATHIIAQSDNSLRNFPEDVIPAERYTTRHDDLLKNDNIGKTIAVYKIVNADDIKLISVDSITREHAV